MPDISKCTAALGDGSLCPLRETCYRFLALPSEYWQSYLTEAPFDGQTCDYHMTPPQALKTILNKNNMWFVSNDGPNYVVIRFTDKGREVAKTFGSTYEDGTRAEEYAKFLNSNGL